VFLLALHGKGRFMAVTYQLERRTQISLDDQLRLECGWTDVARGLRQIVLGYVVLVAGILIGSLLVVMSAIEMGKTGRALGKMSVGGMWQFYAGMGLVSLSSLFSWGMVLAGKFKCLLNAPERHSARWLMFFCLAGALIGPTFNIAAGIAFTQRPLELKRGARGLAEIKLSKTGRVIQVIGMGCGLLSPLAFLLFLRAVARCLERKGVEQFLNGYFAVSVGLIALAGYLLFAPPTAGPRLLLYLAVLGLGWLGWGVTYLIASWFMNSCILQAVGNIRSPLEASA
jgi:hypothetical protein